MQTFSFLPYGPKRSAKECHCRLAAAAAAPGPNLCISPLVLRTTKARTCHFMRYRTRLHTSRAQTLATVRDMGSWKSWSSRVHDAPLPSASHHHHHHQSVPRVKTHAERDAKIEDACAKARRQNGRDLPAARRARGSEADGAKASFSMNPIFRTIKSLSFAYLAWLAGLCRCCCSWLEALLSLPLGGWRLAKRAERTTPSHFRIRWWEAVGPRGWIRMANA